MHIDNLSSIQAVTGAAALPRIPLRRLLLCAGRPYVQMASRAIRARVRFAPANATVLNHTSLDHVRSHTGAIDTPSILNEAVDLAAKEELE